MKRQYRMYNSHFELVCHARTSRNRNNIDFEKSLQQTVDSSKWLVLNPIRLAGSTRSLTVILADKHP